jgi:hypothetical protein
MRRAAKRVLLLLGLFLAVVLVLDAYDSPSVSWSVSELAPEAAAPPRRRPRAREGSTGAATPDLAGRTRFQRRLAPKRSDAPALAAAIALAQGFGGETAYWDPQGER